MASRVLGVDKTTDRFRKTGVFFFSFIMNRMTGARLTDTSTGYRALRVTMMADVIDRLTQEQYQTAELLITCLKRGWRVSRGAHHLVPAPLGHDQEGQELALRFSLRQGGLWHLVARALEAHAPVIELLERDA